MRLIAAIIALFWLTSCCSNKRYLLGPEIAELKAMQGKWWMVSK